MPSPKTAPAKTPGRKAPARKPAPKVTRAAAAKAIADMKDKPKTSTFRGIEITLPTQMPAAFVFDVAEVQEALADGQGIGPMGRLMAGFIGDEQWRVVRKRIAEDGQSIEELADIVTELFATICDPYGADAGK